MNEEMVTLKFKGTSLLIIQSLARQLGTDIGGVLGQGVALLDKVQGKKIILKDKKTALTTEIDLYAGNPARPIPR